MIFHWISKLSEVCLWEWPYTDVGASPEWPRCYPAFRLSGIVIYQVFYRKRLSLLENCLIFQRTAFLVCLPHFLAFCVSFRDFEVEITELFYSLHSKIFMLWYGVKFPQLHDLWNTNLIYIYFSKLLILFWWTSPDTELRRPSVCLTLSPPFQVGVGLGGRQSRKSEGTLTPAPGRICTLFLCKEIYRGNCVFVKLCKKSCFQKSFYLFYKASHI